MTPLQAYLKQLRKNVPKKELGAVLDGITYFVDCTRAKLYRVADPKDRHILKPGPAMLLEVCTHGLVPAESTNPDMADLILALPDWLKTRGIT